MSRTWVALDLETTGTDPAHDRIIEIGAIRFDRDRVLERYTTLVNPARLVPLRVERLTGIESVELIGAPRFSEVREHLRRFIGDSPVVGQNISFDMTFLRGEGLDVRNGLVDTFELASIVVAGAPAYNLAALCRYFGVVLDNAHRAMDDADAARQVFLHLLARIESLPRPVIEEVLRVTARAPWPARAVFESALRVAPDAPAGQGSLRPIRPERPRGGPWRDPVDVDAVAEVLEPGGLFARAFPGYQHRPGQVRMARAVADALNDGDLLAVEAGTGIGKSLAYLLPLVMYAARNRATAVVATNTIALQDQLLGKDIPDLLRSLEAAGIQEVGGTRLEDLAVESLKGRTNYLCRRRWANVRRTPPESVDEARQLARLEVWVPSTTTGDRGELPQMPADGLIWSRVSPQPDNCLTSDCSVLRAGQCFLANARNRAATAHLVVTNHSLLLASVASEGAALPPFELLVVDEAHHLEDQATQQLGRQASRGDWGVLLDRCAMEGPGGAPLGLTADLATLAMHLPDAAEELRDLSGRLLQTVTRLRPQATDLFRRLGHVANQRGGRDSDRRIRVTDEVRSTASWRPVTQAEEAVRESGFELQRLLARSEGLIRDHGTSLEPGELLLEIDSIRLVLDGLLDLASSVVAEPMPDVIQWVDPGQAEEQVLMAEAPLDVAPSLQEKLFGPLHAAIVTSATLSAGDGTLGYFRRRTGLEDCQELIVPGPYDYNNAALLVVPTDIPEPGQQGYQDGVDAALEHLVRAAQGRTLVLFTSHSALRLAHKAIKARLEEDGIAVLGQGIDGSARQILNALRENPRSVVLGAASLWEGVDVVGDTLSLLVIARLPFAVPSDPIYQARSELFQDAFAEYAVPQAVIRFKQGFGRLIRSEGDIGAVAVLDRRVDTKRYGQSFLAALPDVRTYRAPSERCAMAVERWLDPARRTDG